MQFRYCHQFRDFCPHINKSEIEQSLKLRDVKSFCICYTANNEITLIIGGKKVYLKVVLDSNGHYRNNSKSLKVCENDLTLLRPMEHLQFGNLLASRSRSKILLSLFRAFRRNRRLQRL